MKKCGTAVVVIVVTRDRIGLSVARAAMLATG